MINFKAIGSRIKMLRKENGMTQELFAEKLDVSVEHISRIENGVYRPSLALIEKISEVLNTDEQILLFGVGDEQACLRLAGQIELLTDEKRKAVKKIVDLLS